MNVMKPMGRRSVVGAAVLLCAVILLAGPALAQQAQNGTADVPKASKDVDIMLFRSQVIETPWPVTHVAVTEPKVADVQVLTPTHVLVQGRSLGSTDVVLGGENGKIWQTRVNVSADLDGLKAQFAALYPDAVLNVVQQKDVIVITGQLAQAEQVASLRKFLDQTGIKYVDMTSLAGVQQVLLKVRVAEVSRSASRQLGFNFIFRGNDVRAATLVGNFVGAEPFGDVTNFSPAVTVLADIAPWDLTTFLAALADNQYLRILAEPNLVALSGEEASFLAGGEFPIPVPQALGGTGSSSNVITIEYKEFGVRLRFRPTVLGDNRIRLNVAPEVSEVSSTNAIEFAGFSVPSLLTRKAETTLELRSEQTFAMAGLIQHRVTASNSRIPGLGDLPCLGALFRSVRYESGETELVVLVTASLVEPLSLRGMPPTPGMAHRAPSDWELYCAGRIEGQSPPKLDQIEAEWMQERGLHRLVGPGAWATYGSLPAASKAPAVPAEPASVQPMPTTAPSPADSVAPAAP